jgi:L-aminopeptidase/D-esterase-like protein
VDLPAGTVASYEARGGAPASRELELLEPGKAVNAIDGVVLTGGSAFGLAAADGVMRFYREQGRGVQTPAGAVPIVPTLALFDLTAGDPAAAPDSTAGYAAAQACTAEQVLHGQVGAGTGAYVGHWRGPDGRRPGGLGYAEHRLGELVVACLAVVNAFGDVDDGGKDVSFDAVRILAEPFAFGEGRAHTTIGVVVTNARLDKVGCRTVAQGAHDGLARSSPRRPVRSTCTSTSSGCSPSPASPTPYEASRRPDRTLANFTPAQQLGNLGRGRSQVWTRCVRRSRVGRPVMCVDGCRIRGGSG